MTYSLSLYRADQQIFEDPLRWKTPPKATPEQFLEPERKLVYIGGIYNLLGAYQRVQFADVLTIAQAKQPNRPLVFYTLALCKPEARDVFDEEGALSLIHFEKTGKIKPTSYAERLVDDLFAPPPLVAAWRGLQRPDDAMVKHFSNICLVGFSYGHTIIQQLDMCLQQRLLAAGLPHEPLGRVRSISLGPARAPLMDGTIQQLCLVRKADEYAVKAYEKILFDRPNEKMPTRRFGNVLCIGECEGDNWARNITLVESKSPPIDATFFRKESQKGHDLRIYTNRPAMVINDRRGIFTNTCLGALFRIGCAGMLGAENASFSFDSLPGIGELANPTQTEMMSSALRRWRAQTVRQYRKIKACRRSAKIGDTRKLLEAIIASPAPIPVP